MDPNIHHEIWSGVTTTWVTTQDWNGSHSCTYEDYLWGFWYPCSHNAGHGPRCWDLSPCGQCCSGPVASWHLQGPWKKRKFKSVHSKQWLAHTWAYEQKTRPLPPWSFHSTEGQRGKKDISKITAIRDYIRTSRRTVHMPLTIVM